MRPFKYLSGRILMIKIMKNKIKKTILVYGIGLMFLSGLILLMVFFGSGNSKVDRYSASIISVLQDSFDFDTISMKAGVVSHKFELQNEGDESVIIEKVYTSCMCTIAYIFTSSGKKYGEFGMPGHSSSSASIEIGVGDKFSVEAVFDPAAHGPSGVGLAERSVYIETNSAKTPKIELRFTATVTN